MSEPGIQSRPRQVVELDLSTFYSERAKLKDLDRYAAQIREAVSPGAEVIITGAGPVWLYLKVAHLLHGIAARLIYRSPVTGDLMIFDHRPE